MITNDIIISSLNCKHKSYLKQTGQKGVICDYENYYLEQTQNFKNAFFQKISYLKKTNIFFNNLSDNIPINTFDYIINWEYNKADIRIVIDFLEKVTVQGVKTFLPIIIFSTEKISTQEKVIVSCFYYFIKKSKVPLADYCKIIFGVNLKTTKIKPVNYLKQVRSIITCIKSNNEQKVLLNKHCIVCEFNELCKLKATENDCLSLFKGISRKEIEKWNKRGIFTINQLSFNFRPRKTRKENKYHPHKYELRALAVRENTIYILDNPELIYNKNQVYIDFESLPDEDFVYLIGLLIIENGVKKNYSYWAKTKSQEINIFLQFIQRINSYDKYTVFHFGSYEITNLKRIQKYIPHT